MKYFILSLTTYFITIVAMAQTHVTNQPVNYEAANWKIWLLDSAEQIKIAVPPSVAQSKPELQSIKQRVNSLDEKKLENIKYWNAGAPSYRWNKIVIDLLSQKFDVQLR